jgi:SAM-dependent methyltransferase
MEARDMATVTEHYDQHLGPVYSWMIGDMDAAIEANLEELRQLGLQPGDTGSALDLGAGPGLHAIPLARLGFSVVAWDTCAPLLDQLSQRAGGLPIRVIHDDLTLFRHHVNGSVDAILCMGDTLTHLPSLLAVERLLRDIAAAMAAGGVFVTTFRNYASRELQGRDRFIPVRSDAHRILTCFLEYEAETVIVYDLLHERVEAGWQLSVSSYPKLRLDPRWVVERLEAEGLAVRLETPPRSMVKVVARRA